MAHSRILLGVISVLTLIPLLYAGFTFSATGNPALCGTPGTNTFNACYYTGKNFDTFALQRTDAQVAFDWGTASPHPELPSDNFSVRWRGLFTFESGLYEFRVTTDDGARVSVGTSTILESWQDQSATYTVQKYISSGQHAVGVDYYEASGDAKILLSWTKLSTTTGTTTPSNGTTTPATTTPPIITPTTTPATTTPATTTPATTTPTTTEYYPWANPSLWYALPGQTLGFTGTGFAPGETIHLRETGSSTVITATAGSGGALSAPSVLTIPFSWQNSSRQFEVRGLTSNRTIPLTIAIGTFYPQITPSSWWIGFSQPLTVVGTGFAPNELVRLYVQGAQVAEKGADVNGNVAFSIQTPVSGLSAEIRGLGVSSGRDSTRTIFLHP